MEKKVTLDESFAQEVIKKVKKEIPDLTDSEQKAISKTLLRLRFKKKQTQKAVAKRCIELVQNNRELNQLKKEREAREREAREREARERKKEIDHVNWLIKQSELPDGVHTEKPDSE